jgi:hypothetical protein
LPAPVDAGSQRAGAPKVGASRTTGGLIVTGTLVRSSIPVTGDEPGDGVKITGSTDQRIDEDLRQRDHEPPRSRRAMPNLGSRVQMFKPQAGAERGALEATQGGLPVTGSAIGRSARVTGDEAGADRRITGDQYSGSALPAREGDRRDPVTGSKVAVAHTLGRQRVTGVDVETSARVTGGQRGADAPISGSQYSSRGPRDDREVPYVGLTGDVPASDPAVTGLERGRDQLVTGTPYLGAAPETGDGGNRIAAIDDRFSVRSPQRSAHLRAESREDRSRQITGAFDAGGDKITGNREFLFEPRGSERGGTPARLQITGEGRSRNGRLTGDSWSDAGNVTGTEGTFASDRNPSQRGGKPHAFAGARSFARKEYEDGKQLVTGTFGFSGSGARVTLSGGAQA